MTVIRAWENTDARHAMTSPRQRCRITSIQITHVKFLYTSSEQVCFIHCYVKESTIDLSINAQEEEEEVSK